MSKKCVCCVFNCKNAREDARLYKVPRHEKRRRMWYECLEGVSDLTNLIPGVSAVCSIHFEPRFITEKSRLLSNAYPSLFTNDKTLSGTPYSNKKRFDEQQILTDHNYAHKMHFDHTYAKLVTDTGPGVLKDPLPKTTAGMVRSCNELSNGAQPANCFGFGAFEDTVPETEAMAPTYTEMANKTEIESFYDSGALEDPVPESKAEVVPSRIETSNGTKTSNCYGYTKPGWKVQLSQNSSKCRVNELSPMCKKIREEYRKVKKQASALKRALKKRKWCQKTSFEKLTKKMNPYAKKIFSMQIALSKSKSKHSLRFSMEEKLFALSIMKQSPDCYRFLRQIFILPSKATLNAMVASSKPEMNPQVVNLSEKDEENRKSLQDCLKNIKIMLTKLHHAVV